MRIGAGPGVGPEGWLRWSARPFGGAECRGHAQCPAFAPSSSEVAVGVLDFLYLVHNLPQLDMHTVIFSPLWFLCILLLDETFVQVQALQPRVPGPRSQPVSESLPFFAVLSTLYTLLQLRLCVVVSPGGLLAPGRLGLRLIVFPFLMLSRLSLTYSPSTNVC